MKLLAKVLIPTLWVALAQASLFGSVFDQAKTSFESWAESESKENETVDRPKYFHEAGKSEIPNHYDARYQHGVVSYDVKQDTQFHLVRGYLQFFRENRLETWLAHGTLLGWWWNGKRLPWDWDIDMQISYRTLEYIAKSHNRTNYEYNSAKMDSTIQPPVKRTYLLDINPNYADRERGNGNNIIDARWVDIRNGLYIDITGVSEKTGDEDRGLWSCKNNHKYMKTDLYPMRQTMFEGVKAKVPYEYSKILIDEYQEKSLVLGDFQGHRWDPEALEWTKKSIDELRAERYAKFAAGRHGRGAKIAKQRAKQMAKNWAKFEAEKQKLANAP